MKGKVLLAVLVVLALLTISSIPMGSQRPADHHRFDTAAPAEAPGKDSDYDGLTDIQERSLGTNPYDSDTDDDRISDGDEYAYFRARQERGQSGDVGPNGVSKWLNDRFSSAQALNRTGPMGDADLDQAPNLLDRDSDGDRITDGIELDAMLDPLDPDTDHDGVPDKVDRNPRVNQDKDNDGIPDDLEDYEKASSHDSTGDKMDPTDQPSKETLKDALFYVEPSSNPRYWRLRAYDNFDGSGWAMTSTNYGVYSGEPIGTGVRSDVSGSEVTYTLTYNGSTIGHIPTALYTTRLWGVDPKSSVVYTDAYGNFLTQDDVARSYTFSAYSYQFTEKDLNASVPGSDPQLAPYLQLPPKVSGRVNALAMTLGSQATSPYSKAEVIAGYLRDNYQFDINAPTPTVKEKTDLVDWFLFNAREGRSPEFATALVILLRLNGIPSRVAEGYAIGDIEDGRRVVRNGHAHAWGEMYLYGLGWVSIEATGARVAPEGSTGVSSDGADDSVSSGKTNGTGGANGSGTTSKDHSGNITDSISVGTIELSTDKDPVWKGDLFTAYGKIKGIDVKGSMDVTIYLESDPGPGAIPGPGTDNLVVAGKGITKDGNFSVLCSPDQARVGKNMLFASAEGQDNNTMIIVMRPTQTVNITILSSTSFSVDVLDTFLSGDPAKMGFALMDVGGLSYRDKTVNLSWAARAWTVSTLEPAAEATILVTEPVGTYILTLVFPGDDFLSATNWSRSILVDDTRTYMKVTLDPPSQNVTVGDSKFVHVQLVSSDGYYINEEVSVFLDDILLATGIPNGLPIRINFSSEIISAGAHKLKVAYNGTKETPSASVDCNIHVTGRTKILLGPKRTTIGDSLLLSPILVDNLNKPLSGMSMEVTWTFPGGVAESKTAITDTSGTVTISIETGGRSPGKINVTAAFKGAPYYLGTQTNAQISLSSPTVLIVDFPPRLVRERPFEVLGRLFDYRGKGLPDMSIQMYFQGLLIGTVITMSDGSFLFKAEPTILVPLGPATLVARFDGSDVLDPQNNATTIDIFCIPHIYLQGPNTVETGKDYRYTVILTDDRNTPLADREMYINITGSSNGRRIIRTDASGKASFKAGPSGTLMTINASYRGDGYILPGHGLKVAKITIWGLLGVIGSIIIVTVATIAIVNYLVNRNQLRNAEDAIARAKGLNAKDRYRRAIYRTYRSMSRMFAKRGLPRPDSQTVREYETVVSGELPVNGKSLALVTGVFEEARYSRHWLGEHHVAKARKGLKRIDKDLRSDRKEGRVK